MAKKTKIRTKVAATGGIDASQKVRNGKVNRNFKKGEKLTYNRQRYTFVEYADYGFTAYIKNDKTRKKILVFAYEDDLIPLKTQKKR